MEQKVCWLRVTLRETRERGITSVASHCWFVWRESLLRVDERDGLSLKKRGYHTHRSHTREYRMAGSQRAVRQAMVVAMNVCRQHTPRHQG